MADRDRRFVPFFICVVAIFCCSFISTIITLHWIYQLHPEPPFSPNITAIRRFPLPNNGTALVDGQTIEISDNYVVIRTTLSVMQRVVEYLFSELSNHQPRCSPYIQDTFFPDNRLSVTLCLQQEIFMFKLHDDRQFVMFHTEMQPRSVDAFLKKFKDLVL